MQYDQNIHHRRSLRLQTYEYSNNGAYFITICVQNRESLFGEIVEGKMIFSQAGLMIEKWWKELENKYFEVTIDEFVIMPNHLHGIVSIINAQSLERAVPEKPTISKIVQWFKTMTTNRYIFCVKNEGWQTFNGKLWQRNYYEHVIRNEDDLNRIREYIVNNPAKWGEDEENPGSKT